MSLWGLSGFGADGCSSRKDRIGQDCCLCPTNPRVGTSTEESGSTYSIPEILSAHTKYRQIR